MANGAYSFDGVDDGISFSHISTVDGATKLTTAFWVKPISSPFYGYFLAQVGANTSGAGNQTGFGCLQTNTDNTSLFVHARNNDSTAEKSKTGLLSTSIFQPVWVVYDGTQGTVTNRLRVWISGTEITSWGVDSNNFPSSIGTCDRPFTIGLGEGSLFSNCIVSDVGLLFGRAITDSTIASHAGGMSIGNYVAAGDFWASFRVDQHDENGSRTGTLLSAPTLTTGPTLTYPGGGGGLLIPVVMHHLGEMGIAA